MSLRIYAPRCVVYPEHAMDLRKQFEITHTPRGETTGILESGKAFIFCMETKRHMIRAINQGIVP